MIKVLLADDHQIVLDGLRLMLDKEANINVVGMVNNGAEVLNFLRSNSVDIAIVDLKMPKMNGIEVIEHIVKEYPNIYTLVLSMHNEQAFIKKLIEVGVNGYILKNKGQEELVEAINDIAEGKPYFGKEVTQKLIEQIKSDAQKKVDDHPPLTRREKEVLKLIADGHTTPQISELLFIAHSTVETHRRNLIDKLGVDNSTKGLIKWALQNQEALQ